MPPLSGWVYSQLLAFDTTATLSFNAAGIYAEMSSHQRREVVRVAGLLVPWLLAMIGECSKARRGKCARIGESDQRQMLLPPMRGQAEP